MLHGLKRICMKKIVLSCLFLFSLGISCVWPQSPSASCFGVNLSGAEFGGVYPGEDGTHYGYPTYRDLDYFQSKGLSLIRFPFRWERIQPVLNGELDADELGKMKAFVEDAEERGMQVILDVHNFARYSFDGGATYELIGASSRLSKEHLADLWVKLATEFKNFTNIWGYDIMNEPYSMSAQMPWFNIAQAAIDAIRTVDTDTPIIVSGDSFSSSLNWVQFSDNLRNLVDPSDNLIYQAHLYFDNDCSGNYDGTYDEEGANALTGVERARPFVEWLKRYGKRGLVGEYGVPADDSRWLAVLDNLLCYLKSNGVSGTYWSAGLRWGDYALSVQPSNNYEVDRPQMGILEKYPSYGTILPGADAWMLADFEESDGNVRALSGGSIERADNPCQDDVNPSGKVLEVNSMEGMQLGIPFPLSGEGEWPACDALRFKLRVLEVGAGVDKMSFSVGVSNGTEVQWANPAVANAPVWVSGVEGWLDVVLRFNKSLLEDALEGLPDAQYIVVKWEQPICSCLLDDVELLAGVQDGLTDGSEQVLLYDFESDALGASSRYSMPWQGSAEVVANAVPSDYNPSLQCLKVVNPECSPVVLADALPLQTAWDAYDALQFDICFVEGSDIGWAGVEIGVRMDDGTHVKIGSVYDSAGNETSAWHGCSLNTWMPVTLTINPNLLTADVLDNPKLYIRVLKNDNVYLLDNVKLVVKRSPSSADEVEEDARSMAGGMRVYGAARCIVVESGSEVQLPIYSVYGEFAGWLDCEAGENRFDVSPGFYIVGKSKVVVY